MANATPPLSAISQGMNSPAAFAVFYVCFTIDGERYICLVDCWLSKLCVGDTKFEELMTLFLIDNELYLGKTQKL
jgi:hypothetical protein